MKKFFVCVFVCLLTGALMANIVLPQINVTASRMTGIEIEKDNLPTSITVITDDEIKNSNAENLPQILTRYSNIVFFDNGGNDFDYVISLRGFSKGEELAVYLDGVKITKPDNNSIDWQSVVDVEQIERIEIIKSAASAVYGEGAFAGIINIITKDYSKDKYKIKLGNGSYSYYNKSFQMNRDVNGKNLYLYAGNKKSNGYRKNSDYDIDNLNLKLDLYNKAEEYLRLNIFYTNSIAGAPNSLTKDEINTYGRRYTFNPDDYRDVDVFNINLNYENKLKRDLNLGVKPYYLERKTFFDSISRTGLGHQKAKSKEITKGSILQFTKDTDKGKWFIGTEINNTEQSDRNENLTFASLLERFTKKTDYAIFLHNNINISDKLLLNSGVRKENLKIKLNEISASKYSIFKYTPTTYRAGVIYKMKNINLYSNYSEGFLPPNFSDITTYGFGNPNYDLKPEENKLYEIGIRTKYYFDMDLEIAYFINKTKNEIMFNTLTWVNENIGKTKRQGLDVSLRKEISDNIKLIFNYNYTDAKITSRPDTPAQVGKTIPMVPENQMNINLFYSKEKLSADLQYVYVGTRYLQSDNDNIEEKLPSYEVVNLNAGYNIKENLKLSLSINNLFDKKYYTRGVTALDFNFWPAVKKNYYSPAPERNIKTAIEYSF